MILIELDIEDNEESYNSLSLKLREKNRWNI